MGPPREHGGMLLDALERSGMRRLLQWGRRVNTAEWRLRLRLPNPRAVASMGPPREHGGMGTLRINAVAQGLGSRFNGAAA